MPDHEPCLSDLLARFGSAPAGTAPLCPICSQAAHGALRGLRAFAAEYVNDPAERARLRAARGFCGAHSEMLANDGQALAIAILMSDLADEWAQEFAAETGRHARPRLWRRRAPTALECPGCTMEREAEERAIGALADALHLGEVRSAMEAGSPLCAAHASRLLAGSPRGDREWLRAEVLKKLQSLGEELAESVRKNDYRFLGESWGEESTAWRRALGLLRRPER